MLTTYALNQNNILSNYSKSPVKSQLLSNKQVEKIVKQQGIVVNRFVNTLDNNIQNYLIGNIGKSSINLFLPIKNALWQLWNESWFLGQLNAAEELRIAKFNSGDRLVTFNADDLLRADRKQSRKEAKQTKAINELQGFNEKYKTGGEFDVDKILRTGGKRRNDVTDEQINKSINALKKEEDELYTRISGTKQQVEKKERAAKKVIEKPSNTANDEKELTDEEREQLKDKYYEGKKTENKQTGKPKQVKPSKVDNKQYKFPSNDSSNAAYEQVQKLREQQEDVKPPDLENTNFGQAYLDKRFTTIANVSKESFNQSFSTRLNEIIPDYFKDNRSDKDRSYVTKIRRMYISDVQGSNKYKERNDILTSLIDSYVEPEIEKSPTVTKLQDELKLNRSRLNKSKDLSQKRYYRELIAKQEQLLEKELRKADRELNKLQGDNNKFISISQQDKEKLGLTKNSYSIKELEKIRSDVRKQIRQQDQNFYNTKRIALTELNAAYNLGRLDYYQNNNIDYVRWEVSVEHKRRELNSANKNDAGTIRSYNAEGNYGALAGKFQGSVCPVCWERNGRVYSISDVVNDAELQIPVHPFCACILVPVKDDDDDNPNKKKKFKVKTSELLNNSVLKWAAGAGVAILGTAAMYAAFRMTRGKVVQPPLAEQIPKVTKLLPKVIQAPDYIKDSANSVVDTIVDNQDQLLKQAMKTKAKVVNTVKDEVEQIPVDILTALPELQPKPKLLQPALVRDEIELDVIPLGIPDKQIDITPYQAVINNSVNKVNPNTTTSYDDDVTSKLEEVIKQKREFNLITPTHVTNTVRTEVDEIRTRLTQYQSYLRKDLTAAERNRIIQDYRNDITKLNTIIGKYEKDNVLIYGEIKGLTNLRDEGEQLIARNLDKAATDNAKIVFANSEIGRKINNELVELDAILRTRISDINTKGSYYDQAKQLKQQITTSNSELTLDYLNKIKPSIIKSVDKLPNFPIAIDDSLNNLTNLLQQTDKLTSDKFFEYSEALDELTEIVKSIDQRITPTLLDADLNTVIANTTRSSDKNKELLATSQFLLDYQDGIRQIYNRINNLNVALILKFNTITN